MRKRCEVCEWMCSRLSIVDVALDVVIMRAKYHGNVSDVSKAPTA